MFKLFFSECALQPDDVVCTGELALYPISFGASSTLLNADHDKIYFKGMPYFKGRVSPKHLFATSCCPQNGG